MTTAKGAAKALENLDQKGSGRQMGTMAAITSDDAGAAAAPAPPKQLVMKREDIDLLMKEFMLEEQEAMHWLRAAEGDLTQAISLAMDSPVARVVTAKFFEAALMPP